MKPKTGSGIQNRLLWLAGGGVLLVGLSALAVGSRGTPQVSQPAGARPPGSTATSDAPATVAPLQGASADRKAVVVDLEHSGAPVYIGDESASIYVRALIPRGRFRVQYLAADRPARPTELVPPEDLTLAAFPRDGCQDRVRAANRVLQASSVTEFLALKAAFVEASPQSGCKAGFEEVLSQHLERLSPMVSYSVSAPEPGASKSLVVERLGAGGAVEKRFEWPILPAPRPALITETQWIVEQVTARMASLARIGDPVSVSVRPAADRQFEVRVGSRAAAVDARTGPWDPAAYRAVSDGLCPASAAGSRPLSIDVLKSLTDPTIDSLIATNRGLGAALSAEPFNPAAHEASALFLISVALRSSGGGIEDIRPLLNRAVAHLALCRRGDREGYGVEGELALIGLDVLSGREVLAARRLDLLDPRPNLSAGGRALSRALRMRATGDWRVFAEAGATTLEKLEYVRALNRSWSEERASGVVASGVPAPDSPVWARAAVRERTSVELGRAFAPARLGHELGEAAAIAKSFDEPDASRWLLAGGAESGSEPLSSRAWARLESGAVADAALRLHTFIGTLAPSPERADVLDRLSADFKESPEVIAVVVASRLQSNLGMSEADCAPLLKAYEAEPFRLSARLSGFVVQACTSTPRPSADLNVRFTPWTPQGLFDFRNRLLVMPLIPKIAGSDWASLRQLAFYEPQALGFAVGGTREPDSRDYRAFTRERPYSLSLLRDWRFVSSTRGVIEDAVEPAQGACALDSSECLAASDILRALGRTDEAFAAAMRAVGEGPMSVGDSNFVAWIIDENVRRGRVDAARDIADRAATTGSYVGLLVRARLAEREGKLAEAQRRYEQMDAMYDTSTAAEFSVRQRVREGKSSRADIVRALAAVGAPNRVGLSGKGEVTGALISNEWFSTVGAPRRSQAQKMGLKAGDVIVKVNEWPVANEDQMFLALSFSGEEKVSFEVVSGERPALAVLTGVFYRSPYSRIALK